MVEEEDRELPAYYGVWPTLFGIALGLGITIFMFALADGFTG